MEYGDWRILHPHGNEWVEMRREHHDPSEHDIERQLGKGARIYKCPTCDERSVVIPPNPAEGER